MRLKKYDQGKVNRLAKISKILVNADGPSGPHGWTKGLSELWVEKNKLTKEVNNMEKPSA